MALRHSERVVVYLTPEHHEVIRQLAFNAKLSVGAYCRTLIDIIAEAGVDAQSGGPKAPWTREWEAQQKAVKPPGEREVKTDFKR